MEDNRFDLCMERLKAGDKDALREIYTAYGPYIFHFILGILKSREDAEDVTSEFFIRLWKSAEKYKPGGGHKTYITTIARNMAIDHLRSRGKESLIEDIFPQNGEGSDVYTTEERIVAGEGGAVGMLNDADGGVPEDADVTAESAVQKVAMEEALSKLKPPEPQIIHMKFALDMTFAEIAQVLMIPLGTVTWKYREAIGKLRRCGYAF
ncbi:MAG: sigma-70 family RNA polymerase sigma factor [Lachnospiraceae bacterium]|nr:sigma-70 family RNA polymerase sigma factor [Lachnospiraceae bacterium]